MHALRTSTRDVIVISRRSGLYRAFSFLFIFSRELQYSRESPANSKEEGKLFQCTNIEKLEIDSLRWNF